MIIRIFPHKHLCTVYFEIFFRAFFYEHFTRDDVKITIKNNY
jgi:hypothetical protein